MGLADSQHPEKEEMDVDGNLHYAKSIQERGGRMLHVVVNPNVSPHRIITLFF
jgi:hypothetical protein